MPEAPGLGALNLKLLCIDWEFLRTLGCCGANGCVEVETGSAFTGAASG
jgi:hypothetical protein